MIFKYDKQAAMQVDAGQRIRTSGAYKGKFKYVRENKAKDSNATGLKFIFESENGEEATIILWTKGKDGKPINIGCGKIQAMMCCMGIDGEIKPVSGPMKEYDYQLKSLVDVQANLYTELMNKDIGLLLQYKEEEYNGNIIKKLEIVSVFDSLTNQVASEKINGVPAKIMEERSSKLKDIIIDVGQSGDMPPSPPVDSYESDIPF